MKFKRLFLVVVAAFIAMFVVACTDPAAVLEEAQTALIEEYVDTINSSTYVVSDDLTLITTIGEATITWESSNTDVLANDGSITPQADDTTVTLTATLSYEEETLDVPFTVVVAAIPAADQVATAKTALIANYAATIGDDDYEVTSDLNLVTSIEGVSVSWASSDESIVDTDGTVVRPSYTEGSSTVTLTATITKGSTSDTQIFYAYVVSLDQTDEEVMAPVWQVVMAFPENDGITGDETWLTVQYVKATQADVDAGNADAVGDNLEDENGDYTVDTAPFLSSYEINGEDYSISWSSNNTDVFDLVTFTSDKDGDFLVADVTRPSIGESNVDITLTATIIYNGTTFTDTIEFTVLAYEPSSTLASVADILDQDLGTYVKLEGVTIVGVASSGFFFSDGTTVMYVYNSDLAETVEVGEVYDIEGVADMYYGGPQLSDDTGRPVTLTASTADPVSVTGDVTTIADLLDGRVQPSGQFPMDYAFVSLTVKVVVDASDTYSGTNYNTFLVPVDYAGDTVVKTVSSDGHAIEYLTDDILLVYYGSNKAAVEALDGKTITLNALLYGYRSDRYVWYVYFLETSDDITVHLSDAEAVATAKENLPGEFPATFYTGDTLSFPTTLYDTNITYESDTPAIINVDGTVNVPESGQQDVVITATITKGTDPVVTDTVSFTITVGVPEISTINDVITTNEEGDIVKVAGVVTSGEYYGNFTIQDASGAIHIYVGSNAAMNTFFTNNLGNEISVVGEYEDYHGLRRVRADEDFLVVEDAEATMPDATDLSGVMLDDESLDQYLSHLVTLTDMYVAEVSNDQYGNVFIDLVRTADGEEITLKWDERVTLSTEAQTLIDSIEAGQVLSITTVVGMDYGIKLSFTDTTDITVETLSDAEAVAAAKAAVEGFFATQYFEATTLSLLENPVGVTVVYSSESAYFDESTGAITLPATYRETVTVSVTYTLNEATDSSTIEFVVGSLSIEEARTYAADDEVTVQGIITAESNGLFFIQDNTAGITVYNHYSAGDDITWFHDNIGNLVEVTGIISIYHGLIEIKDATYTLVSDTVDPVDATSIDAVDATNEDNFLPYQGMLVSLSQMVIVEYNRDTYDNVSMTLQRSSDGFAVNLEYTSYQDISTAQADILYGLAVGDVVDLEIALGWDNGIELTFTDETVVTEVTATDADLLLVDSALVEIASSITSEDPIALPAAGTNGSAITWSSSHPAIISDAGVVDLPEADTDVTLTATFTLGTDELVVEYVITVVAPVAPGTPDLFISEYIEGGSFNKAIEIYNPTDGDVELSDYSLEIYMNGATEVSGSLNLTGTLASGEVYVVYNSQAGTEITAAGDKVDNTIANFNGDDIVTLSKNGVMIDTAGPVGNANNNNYAANVTLVRVATVVSGNTTYTDTEWTEYSQDTFDYIGSHTSDAPATT